MSTSFKNVTPTGPGGTATLLIVLSFTGFLLLTQSLFVVPSGQVAVVTTLGKVSGGSRRAGLNFKVPFVQYAPKCHRRLAGSYHYDIHNSESTIPAVEFGNA